MKNYNKAIEAALGAATTKPEKRRKARHVFHTELLNGAKVEDALTAALRVAAYNGGRFIKGKEVFWETRKTQDATPVGRIIVWWEKSKAKVGLKGPSVIH